METTNYSEIKTILSGGRIFSVIFRKKDGSIRRMTCRTGVTKGIVRDDDRQRSATGNPDNIMTVWSMTDNGYRSINLDTLLHYKCGDREQWFMTIDDFEIGDTLVRPVIGRFYSDNIDYRVADILLYTGRGENRERLFMPVIGSLYITNEDGLAPFSPDNTKYLAILK